jgi:predicted TIM-barrel fold metal-dependent hydrolase
MFGSNFPIEKLWTTYEDVARVTTECLSDLSADERRAVLHDTAARVYRPAA